MSLINDALRRAKDVQPQITGAATLKTGFRPVERRPLPQHNRTLFSGLIFGAAGLLGGIIIWQSERLASIARPVEINARTVAAAGPSTQKMEAETPVAAVSQGRAADRQAQGQEQLESHPAFPGFAEHTSAAAPPQVTPPLAALAVTNSAAVVETAPARAPLKLQAIVYSRSRPSAIVNGKTLFVGDSVAGMRLAVVTSHSATLTGEGLTKVLELEQ